jgi:hypothetical protein
MGASEIPLIVLQRRRAPVAMQPNRDRMLQTHMLMISLYWMLGRLCLQRRATVKHSNMSVLNSLKTYPFLPPKHAQLALWNIRAGEGAEEQP